jgi:hypothetical protein
MKKFLVLLTVLGLLATPAMAGTTHLEKGKAHHKQAAKHEKKHVKKKAEKKLAKHSGKKHKVAV